MPPRSMIAGLGYYVPERVVTNDDLSAMIDTSDEWISPRTGIKERHWFEPGRDTTSSMGLRAAAMALEDARVRPEEIDFIIFATLSPDYYFPGCGVLVQRQLGIGEIGALDVRTQCSGFIYGLSIADQYIRTGTYRNILLIGAETQSNHFELSQRNRDLAVMFADGAGAAVVQPTEEDGRGVLATKLHSQGEFAEHLCLKEPGSTRAKRIDRELIDSNDDAIWPYMNGRHVFKHAVKRMQEVVLEALEAAGLDLAEVRLVVPHQANLRISEAVREGLGLPEESFFNNIQRYGNTTAASIPIALTEAKLAGKVNRGDLICLVAFGSGFTWGAALMRW